MVEVLSSENTLILPWDMKLQLFETKYVKTLLLLQELYRLKQSYFWYWNSWDVLEVLMKMQRMAYLYVWELLSFIYAHWCPTE